MAHSCFTKAEIKKYNLKGLSRDQQIRKVKETIRGAEHSKKQIKLQAFILHRELGKIRSHPKGSAIGLKSALGTDRWEQSSTSGLESEILAINSKYQSAMYSVMEEFMPRKMGLDVNKADQINLLKAIRGDDVADASFMNLSKAWKKVAEDLRVRFNRAGGDIKFLKDWGIPTHHDEYLLEKAGFEQWRKDISEELDFDSMDISKDDSANIFRDVYFQIISGGKYKGKPGAFQGSTKVANRHKTSRFFKFKDADSQYRYMDKYTDSTVYSVMTDYVSMMSHEIGLMEKFGPNPDRGYRTLTDYVKHDELSDNSTFLADRMYANLAGKTNPVNRKFADRMQTLRNLETGLHLGGATLSAIPDMMFNSLTAKYNGLPAMKVMTRFVKNLTEMNRSESRALAAKLHQSLSFMLDDANSAMRFADVAGHKASSRFASFILKASGLNAWTVAGKMAFHAEFMSHLGGKNWHKNMHGSMKRYGITEDMQKEIKDSVKFNKDGVDYLDPEAISDATRQKVIAMISSEMKYAVPEGDVLVKAVMNQGTRRGEVGGELLRAISMFKTFPATIIANHWMRAMRGFEGNKASRIEYAMAMFIGTTMMGALSYQLKEMSKGREPIDWDKPELWSHAVLAGGGLSILGDVANSNSRGYGSISDFVMGPIGADANKIIWKGILGDMDDMRDADKSISKTVKTAPARALGLGADFVPGQLWYTKLIMERAFLSSMRKLGDPNYVAKKVRREQKHYKEFGNKKMWYAK